MITVGRELQAWTELPLNWKERVIAPAWSLESWIGDPRVRIEGSLSFGGLRYKAFYRSGITRATESDNGDLIIDFASTFAQSL